MLRRLLFTVVFLVHSSSAQITIQGTVRSSGAPSIPIVGAEVRVYKLDIAGIDTSRSLLGTVTSDATGRYVFQDVTSVRSDVRAVPRQFTLSDTYPNPFETKTHIDVSVEKPDNFSVTVFNILGQQLARLKQALPIGTSTIHWQGAPIPGVYFAVVEAGGVKQIVKLVQLARGGAGAHLQFSAGSRMVQAKLMDAQLVTSTGLLQVIVNRKGYHAYKSPILPFTGQSHDVSLMYLGSIFAAKRDSTLTRCGARFDELKRSLPKADAATAMATWLKTQPDVEDAGAEEDGNSWCRFTDGTIAIYVNNFVLNPPPSGARDGVSVPRSTPGVLNHRADMPGSKKMVTINSFGSVFGEHDIHVNSMGYDVGYQASRYTADVDWYKAGNTRDAGIYYIAGHGGYGRVPGGGTEYAIWIGTPHSDSLDEEYADDLIEHRLVWMYGLKDVDYSDPTKPIENNYWAYAFTGQFVREYMSFAPNSLVFIAGCSSATNNAFVNAFLAKGAAAFAGFTNTWWSDYLNKCVDAFFDRCFGANSEYVEKESPRQRAFAWPEVLDWMRSKNLDYGAAGGSSRLVVITQSGVDKPAQPLAPSIASMSVSTFDQKLYLWGLFGDNPGADGVVTVNGTQLQVQEWVSGGASQMDLIVCKISDEGAGSYGDVQVKVRDVKSNITQLTRYKGSFTLTHETGDGRQFEVKLTLQFRVHLLGFRLKPGGAPTFNQNTYVVDADMCSTGESTASGATGGLLWSGHVTGLRSNIDGGAPETGFVVGAWFDPEKKTMQLYLFGAVKDGITQHANGVTSQLNIVFGLDEFDGKHGYFPSYVEIPLGSDFSIAKGSATATKVIGYYTASRSDKVTIKWDAITCESSPKEDTPR
jgi:hypothetical protein